MGIAERNKRAKEIRRYMENSKPGEPIDPVLFHFAYVIEAAEGDDDNLPLFVSERIDKWLKNNPK